MSNSKTLPNIQGTEAISQSWRKLLERDRNASNLFSGDAFTTDQTEEDVGRPNWRTDLKRLFILEGFESGSPVFKDLFSYLTPEEIKYTNEEFPSGVKNISEALTYLAKRQLLNAVVIPSGSSEFIADGITNEYELNSVTSHKELIDIYIDGVKQTTSTFSINEDGTKVILKAVPSYGETIEIIEKASLLNYDFQPVVKFFTGDGATSTFDYGFDLYDRNQVSVNIEGLELQKDQFEIVEDTKVHLLNVIPAEGKIVQIYTLIKGSLIKVSPNSVGSDELQDSSVTMKKIGDDVVFGTNRIEDGSITEIKLASNSVSESKIAAKSVSSDKIADAAVTLDHLADSVKSKFIQDNSIGTTELKDRAVTSDKLGDDVNAKFDQAMANVKDATASQKGVVYLATDNEALTGTDNSKAITAQNLKYVDDYKQSRSFGIKTNNLNVANNPSIKTGVNGFYLKDGENHFLGKLDGFLSPEGTFYLQLQAGNIKSDGTQAYSDSVTLAQDRNGVTTFNIPTPSTNANGTQAVNGMYLNDPARSTSIVHRAGTETISGNKTFSGSNSYTNTNTFSGTTNLNGTVNMNSAVNINGNIIQKRPSGQPFRIYNTDFARGTIPSANKISQIRFDDKNGAWCGYIDNAYSTDGSLITRIACNSPDGSKSTTLSIGITENNTVFTSVPTPASNSNNTNIANTSWTRTLVNNSIKSAFNDLNYTANRIFSPSSPLGQGNITLTKAFTSFSWLRIFVTNDGGTAADIKWIYVPDLVQKLNFTAKDVVLINHASGFWVVYNYANGTTNTFLKYQSDHSLAIHWIEGVNF